MVLLHHDSHGWNISLANAHMVKRISPTMAGGLSYVLLPKIHLIDILQIGSVTLPKRYGHIFLRREKMFPLPDLGSITFLSVRFLRSDAE